MRKTFIWRHRKENLKKCSLSGLEGVEGLVFFTYPTDPLPELTGAVVLQVGAPPLSLEDKDCDLLLIDGTWRYAEVMAGQLPHGLAARSLPGGSVTAYPRRQEVEGGLASVEALYLAHHLLGRRTEGLLDHYYWRGPFLERNRELLSR
ncbi:MAG: hypothetical protein AB7F31_06935 [Parachlamydiales bacterium]